MPHCRYMQNICPVSSWINCTLTTNDCVCADGWYDCAGNCVGTSYKSSRTNSGLNMECNGSGSCVSVSFCCIPQNLGGLCNGSCQSLEILNCFGR